MQDAVAGVQAGLEVLVVYSPDDEVVATINYTIM